MKRARRKNWLSRSRSCEASWTNRLQWWKEHQTPDGIKLVQAVKASLAVETKINDKLIPIAMAGDIPSSSRS